MSIYPSLIKRTYDFITLGWFKWWFFLGYLLCFVASKIILLLPEFNHYLLPRGLGYFPPDISYWVYSGFLPLRFPDMLFQWNYKWVQSSLYSQIGIPLIGILFFILLVAYFRGE